MKKYFLAVLIIAIAPNICFGAGARYTQLVREKQRKMEELEKCMASTKGLKIAGLSTIGLTAVGVAGNVVEAQKIKEYESDIEKTTKNIANVKSDITKKDEEIAKEKTAQTHNSNSVNSSATVGQSGGGTDNSRETINVDEDTLATMQNIVDNANFDFPATEEEVESTTEMIKYQEQIGACVSSGGSWVDFKCECESGYTVGADGRCVIISSADNSAQKSASSSTHTT